MKPGQGRFVQGFAIGILVGLALATGVGVAVATAKPPFIDKVPRQPPHTEADDEKNRAWDPNTALKNTTPLRPAQPPASQAPN